MRSAKICDAHAICRVASGVFGAIGVLSAPATGSGRSTTTQNRSVYQLRHAAFKCNTLPEMRRENRSYSQGTQAVAAGCRVDAAQDCCSSQDQSCACRLSGERKTLTKRGSGRALLEIQSAMKPRRRYVICGPLSSATLFGESGERCGGGLDCCSNCEAAETPR